MPTLKEMNRQLWGCGLRPHPHIGLLLSLRWPLFRSLLDRLKDSLQPRSTRTWVRQGQDRRRRLRRGVRTTRRPPTGSQGFPRVAREPLAAYPGAFSLSPGHRTAAEPASRPWWPYKKKRAPCHPLDGRHCRSCRKAHHVGIPYGRASLQPGRRCRFPTTIHGEWSGQFG